MAVEDFEVIQALENYIYSEAGVVMRRAIVSSAILPIVTFHYIIV